LCFNEGGFKEARRYYEESLTMKWKVLGEKAAHPDIAALLHQLGRVCYKEGGLTEAVQNMEQAWVMQDKTTGEAHPTTKTMLKSLQFVKMKFREAADVPTSTPRRWNCSKRAFISH
jgi:hypothetical protein